MSLEEFIRNVVKENTDFPFAVLNLCLDDVQSTDIINSYATHIINHNTAAQSDLFPNSGFDIFVPNNVMFNTPFQTAMIDHEIICEMVHYTPTDRSYVASPFYMYPRSSLSKSPLMLANHVGVIDSGYRGHLIGAFRWFPEADPKNNYSYTVEKQTRLLQVCHPSLCPIFVRLVDKRELTDTTRGAGGFGSTGK